MHLVVPQVYLIARPSMDWEQVRAYLTEVDGMVWLDRMYEAASTNETVPNDAEALVEFGGRLCYRSWSPGLNPNISRVRTDSHEYLGNILKSGHGSVIEHANFSFVLHNVSRVLCYDDQTEVLTEDGWKPWPEVTGDEYFAQVDPVTQEMTYAPARERFRRHYRGPMYRLESEQVDLLVTPHHLLYVQRHDTQAARRDEQGWEKVSAEDVIGKRVHHLKTVLWRGSEPEKVRVPDTERTYQRNDRESPSTRLYRGWSFSVEVWAEWLGWYLAEGCLNDGHRIYITQNVGEGLDRILQLSNEMGPVRGSVVLSRSHEEGRRVQMSNACLHDWLRDTTGGKSWEKRVPQYVFGWSPRLIRILLDAMVRGDGSQRVDGGHRVIYTTSRQLADDLQVLAMMAGWSANIREDDRVGQSGGREEIISRRICYIVSLVETRTRPLVNHNRSGRPKHDEMVHYDGEVHCVSVPTGLLVVRRNGKPVVCGNTHELVRHRVGAALSQESMRFVRLEDLPFWFPDWAQADSALMQMALIVLDEIEKFQFWMAHHFGLDAEKDCSECEGRGWVDAEPDGGTPDCLSCEGKGVVPAVPFSEKKIKTSFMRRFAPDGVATGILATFNVRTLRHIIYMRTALGAEEEIRIVCDEIAEKTLAEVPSLMQDYSPNEWREWIPEFVKV